MKYLLLLIIILSRFGPSFAQINMQNMFKWRRASAKVVYSEPKGFHFDTSASTFFSYTATKYIYPLDGQILNNDSSICIGFHAVKVFQKMDTAKIFQKIYPRRKSNTEYKLPIRHKADTINHKVKYYSPEKSSNQYHATIAGDYYMSDFEKPYKMRYYRCRVVFMHKENTGDAEIYFFYNEKDAKKIDTMINTAHKILHF